MACYKSISGRIATLSQQVEALRDEMAPKIKEAADHARPLVEQGIAASKDTLTVAKGKIKDDVLPAAAKTIGTTLAVAESLRPSRIAEIVKPVVQEVPQKKHGVGKWVALTVGAVAVIGVGVAAYRALSVADEHWIGIEDDFPDTNENPLEDIANEIADAVKK